MLDQILSKMPFFPNPFLPIRNTRSFISVEGSQLVAKLPRLATARSTWPSRKKMPVVTEAATYPENGGSRFL
jgi:hypothetical protein